MKQTIILLAVLALSYGIEYDDLRVKFSFSSELENVEYFFRIPRTTLAAVLSGWRQTERPPGPLSRLRMYCPSGRAVCALYETLGHIAGLQVALAVDEFETPIDAEKRFIRWSAPATRSEPAREFWTATQYFVNEDTMKAGSEIEGQRSTLRDTGVWVADLNGNLIPMPIAESELDNTDFKRQACVPGMGMHYYYNMTPSMECENMLPWFALTQDGVLVGSGFQMFGTLPVPTDERDWFERPPAAASLLAIPHAPPCVYDWATVYGVVSLHIYYSSEPWNIPCEA